MQSGLSSKEGGDSPLLEDEKAETPRGGTPHVQTAFFPTEHSFYSLEAAEETACLIQHEANLLLKSPRSETGESTGLDLVKAEIVEEEASVALINFFRLNFICFAQIGTSAISVTYLSILLPQEILRLVGSSDKGSVLGGLSAGAGILSIISPPIIGYLSDRHNGPLGRRKPYMIAGMVLTTISLVIAGAAASAVSMASLSAIYFGITLGGLIHCTAFNATIPEFPRQQFGTISGIVGALTVVGFSVGAALGAASNSIGESMTFYILSSVVFITGMVTLIAYTENMEGFEPEVDDQDGTVVKESKGILVKTKDILTGMISPFRDHDFRWVFTTRLFVQFGVFTVQEFMLFWVEDVLPVEGLSTASRAAILFIPVFVSALISSLVIGKVSDDLGGERKRFLIASSFIMCVLCIIMAFVRSYYAALVLMLFFGGAMGSFLALDYALICDILPDKNNVARDLGVWHISIVLPQLIAAPMAGALLDSLQKVGLRTGHPHLGYTIIFCLSALYFLIAGCCFFCLKNVK